MPEKLSTSPRASIRAVGFGTTVRAGLDSDHNNSPICRAGADATSGDVSGHREVPLPEVWLREGQVAALFP